MKRIENIKNLLIDYIQYQISKGNKSAYFIPELEYLNNLVTSLSSQTLKDEIRGNYFLNIILKNAFKKRLNTENYVRCK